MPAAATVAVAVTSSPSDARRQRRLALPTTCSRPGRPDPPATMDLVARLTQRWRWRLRGRRAQRVETPTADAAFAAAAAASAVAAAAAVTAATADARVPGSAPPIPIGRLMAPSTLALATR